MYFGRFKVVAAGKEMLIFCKRMQLLHVVGSHCLQKGGKSPKYKSLRKEVEKFFLGPDSPPFKLRLGQLEFELFPPWSETFNTTEPLLGSTSCLGLSAAAAVGRPRAPLPQKAKRSTQVMSIIMPEICRTEDQKLRS